MSKQIFMGNGEDSEKEVGKLHQKLDKAISNLSGLQQGFPSMTKFEIEIHHTKIVRLAGELFTSLTGEHIIKTKKIET